MRDYEIIIKILNGTRSDDDLILTNANTENSITWLSRIIELEKNIRSVSKEMFVIEDMISHMSQDIESLSHYKSLLVSKRSKLENLVYKHPMWNHWLINVSGVDATFAGYLLGFIDWNKNIFEILKYCGLDSNSKNNATLFKKIIHAAGYFVSKSSPWAIHFYEYIINDIKINKYKEYNKMKGRCMSVGKRKMMRQFIIDFWVIYNTIVRNSSVSNFKVTEAIKEITSVDRYDFINIPYYPRLGQPIDARSHLYRVSLKYKKRLNRYRIMYNTLCERS